jgi:polygalacturonase
VPIGTLKRIRINNLVSSNGSPLPAVIAGLAEKPIEDVAISDVLLHQVGGAAPAMAKLQPPENELGYPEADMFGDLPATGLFARHVRGLTLSNVEVQVARPDPRPALWLQDVSDIDLFGLRLPDGPAFTLDRVRRLRSVAVRGTADRRID